MIEITVALISSLIAIISSVVAEFWPGWAKWQYKRLTQVIISLIFPVAVYVLKCPVGLDLPFVVACDFLGFFKLLGIGVSAVLAGAGTYHLAVRPATARHRDEYNKCNTSGCSGGCC